MIHYFCLILWKIKGKLRLLSPDEIHVLAIHVVIDTHGCSIIGYITDGGVVQGIDHTFLTSCSVIYLRDGSDTDIDMVLLIEGLTAIQLVDAASHNCTIFLKV